MQRRNREISIFSISAIDLFCSGLGAVMVLFVILLPYFRMQSPEPPVPAPPVVEPAPPAIVVTPPAPVPPVPPTPPGSPITIHDLEILLIIDTTGSMGGQIRDLSDSLITLVEVLSRLTENLRVGAIAYRDHGDEYLTLSHPLQRIDPGTAEFRALHQFISSLEASGGGDFPEAVYEAMTAGAHPSVGWTSLVDLPPDTIQSILFIADAPGHDANAANASRVARQWRQGDERRSVNAAISRHPGRTAEQEARMLEITRAYFRELTSNGGGTMVPYTDILSVILDLTINRAGTSG